MLIWQAGCVSGPIDPDANSIKAAPETTVTPSNPIIPRKNVAKVIVPDTRDKPEIKSLEGRDAKNIQRLFGMPVFVRKDFHTQLWRYKKEDCIINMAMYPTESDINYRVVHSEITDENGKSIDPAHCLKKLLLNDLEVRG